jgi:hypothetical protein
MRATHARFPDYQYRFFPTHDPNTWEKDEQEGAGTTEGPSGGTYGDKGQTHQMTIGGRDKSRDHTGGGYTGGRTASQRPTDNGWLEIRRQRVGEGGGQQNGPAGSQRSATGSLRQTTLDAHRQAGGRVTTGPAAPSERSRGTRSWADVMEQEGGPARERLRSPSDTSLYG